MPVFSSDQVFQKNSPGLRSAPSGGFSPANLEEMVQLGAPITGADVFVVAGLAVAITSAGGVAVKVGELAIFVNEF